MKKKYKGGEKVFKRWKVMNCLLLLQVVEIINFYNISCKVDNELKVLIEIKF